jgi:TetR/AcrR family transcriptional regulator
MGISERRERERQQRQNAIIDAAEQLFFSKGVENTTMDEVAVAAELSKGTLYLYFKNKDDLYHAIVERGLKVLLEIFHEAAGKQTAAIDQIREIGKAYAEFQREYPDYFNALLHHESREIDMSAVEENPFMSRCSELGNRVFQFLQEVVKRGIADGSIRSDLDPLKLSLVVWGHATGIMQVVRAKKKVIEDIMGINGEELITYSFELMQKYIEKR